jgi:hypothetical protein
MMSVGKTVAAPIITGLTILSAAMIALHKELQTFRIESL